MDVDIVCPTEIARGTGRLIPDKLLVLPTVCYGYTGHVMDFPGTIKQLADAGFQRIELCSPVGYADSGFGGLANLKGAELRRILSDAGVG